MSRDPLSEILRLAFEGATARVLKENSKYEEETFQKIQQAMHNVLDLFSEAGLIINEENNVQ